MIYKKYFNLRCLFISLFIAIAMNVSIVKAEDSIASDIDTSQSDINELQNVFDENQPAEGEEGAIEEFELSIEGMTSDQDAVTVKEALWNCKGVEGVEVSHKDANAKIKLYVEEADYYEIVSAVEKAGFTVLEQE